MFSRGGAVAVLISCKPVSTVAIGCDAAESPAFLIRPAFFFLLPLLCVRTFLLFERDRVLAAGQCLLSVALEPHAPPAPLAGVIRSF